MVVDSKEPLRRRRRQHRLLRAGNRVKIIARIQRVVFHLSIPISRYELAAFYPFASRNRSSIPILTHFISKLCRCIIYLK